MTRVQKPWRPRFERLNTLRRIWADVTAEMERSASRPYPSDPLRRSALVAEEAGEALAAALDLTRDPGHADAGVLRERLRTELIHTAAVTLRALGAMARDDFDRANPPEEAK